MHFQSIINYILSSNQEMKVFDLGMAKHSFQHNHKSKTFKKNRRKELKANLRKRS
jgi:hypothetical protein